jgi:hypothetical protein
LLTNVHSELHRYVIDTELQLSGKKSLKIPKDGKNRYKFIVIGHGIWFCQARKEIKYATPKIDSDCPFGIFKLFLPLSWSSVSMTKLHNILICVLLKKEEKATDLLKYKHETCVDYLLGAKPQCHISDRGQHLQQSIKLTSSVSIT